MNMQLIPNTEPRRVEAMDDEAIIALFAEAGLTVEIVDTCGDASCPDCHSPAPARAA